MINIKKIEEFTEAEVKEMALESMILKDHNIYFVDFENSGFGYSALVFKNNHHIHYANEYELHYGYKVKRDGKESLHDYYIEKLNNKLFTETEIAEPLKDYDEFRRKDEFLRNYYNMRVDYVSMFFINDSKAAEEKHRKQIKGLHYDPVSFCYIADEDFIKHHIQLHIELTNAKENMKDNYEYQKEAFIREMFNHEYSINWDADVDTLSAFGNIPFKRGEYTLDELFDLCGFNEMQRKAYKDAKREYYKRIGEEEIA